MVPSTFSLLKRKPKRTKVPMRTPRSEIGTPAIFEAIEFVVRSQVKNELMSQRPPELIPVGNFVLK